MKKNKILFIVLLTFLIGFFINSCKKDKDEELIDMEQTTQDDAVVENIFDDLSKQATMYQNYGLKLETEGPEVTITFPEYHKKFPRHIVVDFGTEGCKGYFGKIRKGKIIIAQTAPMWMKDAVRIITLEDFYFDEYKIEGTKTVTWTGGSEDSFFEYTKVLKGGKVTLPDGKVIKREAEHTTKWLAGFGTPYNIFDDKWSIEGSAEGVNRHGFSYTSVIIKALIIDMSCKWKLVKGTVKINSGNMEVLIDYGEGDCDNEITITRNGESKIIYIGGDN